jgi:hypothetical protein
MEVAASPAALRQGFGSSCRIAARGDLAERFHHGDVDRRPLCSFSRLISVTTDPVGLET